MSGVFNSVFIVLIMLGQLFWELLVLDQIFLIYLKMPSLLGWTSNPELTKLSFCTFYYGSECTFSHPLSTGAVLGPCSWMLCLSRVSECVPLILLHLRDSWYFMMLWVVWLLSLPLSKRFLLPLSATQTFQHTSAFFTCKGHSCSWTMCSL